MNEHWQALAKLIEELQTDLNQTVREFQQKHDVPVILEVTTPEQRALGEKPIQEIVVSIIV